MFSEMAEKQRIKQNPNMVFQQQEISIGFDFEAIASAARTNAIGS